MSTGKYRSLLGSLLYACAALTAAQAFCEQPQTRPKRVIASQYGKGDGFANKKTASGEKMDPNALTAAHKSLPLGSKVEVKKPETGKEVTVKINDRGPYVKGRELDLSHRAAAELGLPKGNGVVEMKVVETPTPEKRS